MSAYKKMEDMLEHLRMLYTRGEFMHPDKYQKIYKRNVYDKAMKNYFKFAEESLMERNMVVSLALFKALGSDKVGYPTCSIVEYNQKLIMPIYCLIYVGDC